VRGLWAQTWPETGPADAGTAAAQSGLGLIDHVIFRRGRLGVDRSTLFHNRNRGGTWEGRVEHGRALGGEGVSGLQQKSAASRTNHNVPALSFLRLRRFPQLL